MSTAFHVVLSVRTTLSAPAASRFHIAMSGSGAASEVDEAISQVAIDALLM